MAYTVHKFGGSSLADAKKIRNIISIIQGRNEAIIVSASGKTTRMLNQAIELAKTGQDYQKVLLQVTMHHTGLLDALDIDDQALYDQITTDIEHISQMLLTIQLSQICADSLSHFILGFGEIFSARILTAFLQTQKIKASFIDASKLLFVDDSVMPASVDWDKSQKSLSQYIKQSGEIYVITGFIAQNTEGHRTILGMNCSDYSAAIFARLLNAEKLIIWTDVAGVYSANPQVVPQARQLRCLSYKEALELAYFGASVVHPLTINPMMKASIPIYIKSSFNPKDQGTIITDQAISQTGSPYLIKGLTSIQGVSLMRVQGVGMIGVSGIAAKVFSVLEKANISVMMISQSSSEYSICFAVDAQNAKKAVKVLEKSFKSEIEQGLIEHIYCESNYSMITAVGDGMRFQPGTLSKVIKPLADAKINVHAITQGSSERSITVTVKDEDEHVALNLIHAQAKKAPVNEVAVALIGVGNVAKSLILQMQKQHEVLLKQNIELRIIGVINSKHMVLGSNLLQENWLDKLKNSKQKASVTELKTHLLAQPVAKKILIDATANAKIARSYLPFLESGIDVVTPNKYANTEDLSYYYALRKTSIDHQSKFKYETNVCAGLPVIQTLQNMQLTGDKIHKIQGVFSGTLSYIFNQMNQGKSFIDSLFDAYEKGFTEPDPRQDLSGMDVARKVICLAREIGLEVNLDDILIESLVPEALHQESVETFLIRVKEYDRKITSKLQKIKQQAPALHFIGEITASGTVAVGIKPLDGKSPFAHLTGTDNMILIYSDYYQKNPLLISGAGAGSIVTASGVFADVLSLIK
ncbi:bifunctional aspartate kinase/homoserine dehydrogenase I [Facilibium subflavum]|uniref:bifunctional aspartate kinase/homoserine dehydrogenase I n=1 Tax=Facilibium subflavum TaxID=2219058 RepID=UPI000E65A0DD|nr:bifunctional aspartate kinase/homoserine dehydrogenase I [Facilibium subflavum]